MMRILIAFSVLIALGCGAQAQTRPALGGMVTPSPLGTGVLSALGNAVTGSGSFVLSTSPTVASPTYTGTVTLPGGATATSGSGGTDLTGLYSPVNPSDAATKQYVDNSVVGLAIHTPARLATTTALPTNTYNNGSSGVGATLTATANAALSVDSVSVNVSDRIVVKNEATAANNGIYVVTQTGSVSAPYILTRATDANTPGTGNPNEIGSGTYTLITAGFTQAGTAWIVSSTVTTIGTSAINWTQFSAASSATACGSTGQIQVNSSGVFGCSGNFTWTQTGGLLYTNTSGFTGTATANGQALIGAGASSGGQLTGQGTACDVDLYGRGSGANYFCLAANSTNFGFNTTTPVFDGNASTNAYLMFNQPLAHGVAEIGAAGNATTAGDVVGNFAFVNSSLGTTDKRIALIQGATNGATNSGQLNFDVWNAGSPLIAMTILPSTNIGIGATNPSSKLEVDNGQIYSNIDGNNAFAMNSTGTNFGFISNNAANTWSLGYGTTLNSLGTPVLVWDASGNIEGRNLQNFTDLRLWASLSCNPSVPTSTGVAAAAVAAYNAGYRYFYVPSGCFLNLDDSAWTGTFTAYAIPTNTHWRGGDWTTSGFSVCANYNYSGCSTTQSLSMGPNSSYENMFQASADCYELDGGIYGNPQFCPANFANNNGNGFLFMTNYPYQFINNYCSPFTVPGATGVVDAACIGITQESQGDGLYIASYNTNGSGDTYAKNINMFAAGFSTGTAGMGGPKFINAVANIGEDFQVFWDGSMSIGNSNTSPTNGVFRATDSVGSCVLFPAASGAPGWSCSSDARLKNNIEDSHNQLAWLNSFHIRQFDLRSDGEHIPAGVIAQELERNHPEMVRVSDAETKCDTKDLKGCYSVSSPSPWQMMKAMQDMQAEIEALRAELHR